MGHPLEIAVFEEGRADTERIVEYKWVSKNLIPKGRILDVGCCDSRIAPVLVGLKYDVYGIDIRDYGYVEGWVFVRRDIRRTAFPSEFFDQILAVSTIEHVGMNCYGNTWIDREHGDRMAILEMYRILKQGGSMLITLPYGASKGDYWIRYYNRQSLHSLLEGWLDFDSDFYMKEGGQWQECSEEEASKMPSGEGALPQALVCLKVVK